MKYDGVDKFYLLPSLGNYIYILDNTFNYVCTLADFGASYVYKLGYDRVKKDLFAFDYYSTNYAIRKFLFVRGSLLIEG